MVALPLPQDLAACHALLEEQARTLAAQQERIASLERLDAEQKLTIDELLQRLLRQRAARYLQDPRQLALDLGGGPEADDAAASLADAILEAHGLGETGDARAPRRPRRRRRERLPEHLPRYEVFATVPDDVRECGVHGPKKLLGYDRQETLEFTPLQLRVRVTLFPKYVCEDAPECGVSTPPRPAGLVEGNRFDVSVAVEILLFKFGFHLPLYRQQDLFAGSGWCPSRSTLGNILFACYTLAIPLVDYLRDLAIGTGLLATDDTRTLLLLPQGPLTPPDAAADAKACRVYEVFQAARQAGAASVNGHMWAYRSLLLPLNIFDFTVSRHRDGPDQFLVESGFTGTLLADCYSGYQGIALRSEERIARAACNAHALRKLEEARENHPLLASRLLAIYRRIYDLEDRARSLSAAERLALRMAEGRPLWDAMRAVLDSEMAQQTLPKEKITEALGYLRNQWDALKFYLSDGRLPIDNNETEQLMKQVAIGRKNWLFVGSVEAGERAANFLTLVSSALRCDLDVRQYLQAVFTELLAGSTDYASLRPDFWAAAHPEAIRVYRQEERRQRSSARAARRQERRMREAAAASSSC